MTALTVEEIQRAWVSESLWRQLEEAEDVIRDAGHAAYTEAGRQVDPATQLLERRARPGTRLQWALQRVCVYERMMAYVLNEGWEPAPGARPGVMHRRPGGPLPLAERRRLADALGVPLELLDDDDEGD